MIASNTKISDVLLIETKVFDDSRGFFFESYTKSNFDKFVNEEINFVQDNHSFSKFGVLRGLHFQRTPYSQGKLVREVVGEIFDVAVDLRKNSSTYGHWVSEILSAENKKQLWIPEGFAHGFLTLSNDAEVCYKTTNFYNSDYEGCIIYNDPDLDIKWPPIVNKYILSEKDLMGKAFKNI